MSHGSSRNEAVKKAAEYNARNIPYKTAYAIETLKSRRIIFDGKRFKKNVAAAAAAINNLSSAVKRAFGRGVC
jgi:uncharacterized membrane protein (UPF0182 family)